MNRIVGFVMIIGLFSLLTGCQSDKKQAAEIHTKIEESATFEKEFVADQKDLVKSREKVQAVYQDIIALNSTDTNAIKQTLSDHEMSTEKQQLNEAEKNFQSAYQKLMSIDENIELIKDKDQKKKATKLTTLMNTRKKSMETFFNTYRDQMKTQNTFFQNLEQGNFELDTLEDEIHHINEDSEKMEKVIKQFNQDTKRYNEVENDYFGMAGLS
ncbi:hypothetical protein DVB69_06390 [Sporosarcina sp. BI001-red]|uniref:YkyA family protein n=1 Tax=Sporosarcina sp. BI001-red TaxID=2282866 RepID=UPI000E289054|nr:YkyA family protein [Sporosarcina sp. BI001-red]REB08750.1 hypothetical protein DVB69_06390 [Sporosarcina sp. BI001-red]